MKKVSIFLLLIMFIIFSSINPVIAEEYHPYSNLTDDEIELVHYIERKELEFNNIDGEVVLVYQLSGKLTPEGLIFVDNKEKQNEKGSIDPEIMTITVAVKRINASNTTYDDFMFTAIADWYSAPLVRSEDAIALAWSDDFSQYSHNCKAYYNSIGYVSGKTVQIDSTPEVGVCYSVDCADNYVQALDYVTLTVYAKKLNSVGTAAVSTKYAHKTLSFLELSVSFGINTSISFTPALCVNTIATDGYFEY